MATNDTATTTTSTTTSVPAPSGTPTGSAAGTWRLGDRTVHRVGFGAMRLTGMPWDERPRDRDTAIAVLRRAVELGVNHIDTAAFYFLPTRSANELISTALYPYGEDLVIATKVGPARDGAKRFAFAPYPRPEELRGQVEENVRQLGVDHLEVVNLRWGTGMDKEPGSLADHLGALTELRDAGLLAHIGVSNVDAAQLTEAMTVTPVVEVQNRYGLTERDDDDLVALTGEHGIAFVPFFSVGAAVPGAVPGGAAAPGQEETAAVAAVAAAHGATPAQVRLAWTLHRGEHVLAIPGTGDLGHLEQNVAAGALRLSAEELARLDAIAPAA